MGYCLFKRYSATYSRFRMVFMAAHTMDLSHYRYVNFLEEKPPHALKLHKIYINAMSDVTN